MRIGVQSKPQGIMGGEGLCWGNKISISWSREKNSHNGTQSPTPQTFVWMHSGIDKSPERTGQASSPHSLTDYKKELFEPMLHEKTGASVGTTFLLAKLLRGCCVRPKSDDFPIHLKRE